jgi:hypothetical protein
VDEVFCPTRAPLHPAPDRQPARAATRPNCHLLLASRRRSCRPRPFASLMPCLVRDRGLGSAEGEVVAVHGADFQIEAGRRPWRVIRADAGSAECHPGACATFGLLPAACAAACGCGALRPGDAQRAAEPSRMRRTPCRWCSRTRSPRCRPGSPWRNRGSKGCWCGEPGLSAADRRVRVLAALQDTGPGHRRATRLGLLRLPASVRVGNGGGWPSPGR